MKHKQGTARDQISFSSFEDRISRDNPVRFIDVFSGKLDFQSKLCRKKDDPVLRAVCLFVSTCMYRKRQEINEHIFGTIKRQWGYNHTNLNGLEKVGGEHALILLVYNIKRSMNILGVPDLIEKLKNFKHPYMKDGCFVFFRVNFKHMSALLFFQQKMAV